VYALAGIPGVTIDSITTSADVEASVATYRLAQLEVKHAGTWFPVGRRMPILARPGQRIVARATLEGKGGPITLPIKMQVPSQARRLMFLQVRGGDGAFGSRPPRSVAKAKAWVADLVRSDAVQASLTKRPGGGDEMTMEESFARRAADQTKVLAQLDRVVKGELVVPVLVR
jgi:hypothetical protein